ncbi:MAG: tetratricopeptide repeat protein [Candidatus Marinimicrobia bacterium]|jgi:TolA-binding protein|nr:tetratricopeptide repeat protein [Candidatus Neomarinimicrobiota bacterium]MBT3692762.1 tetratricopeptide repeat protein [Candidatus Neomarinimicrobiota bacterium]MBT3731623.1 tetratricopeptide repeat protein [Candidatus Neomarinimicrobiota bacterium]MBT4592977.1 tetratricopeptide repeat protein [Candidatus Neomarinimicrobiota bacterium]MBT4990542.1 tetratricopeptide repeat protein [Candidatus Neomarinimicrobiota bacterium]
MIAQFKHLWLILVLSFFSCAYFNTFYNAQSYFDKAEDQRLEKLGQKLPTAVLDNYGKSIQKCQKVIDDYPDSRFKIPAMFLMSKAKFYRGEYKSALGQLLDIQRMENEDYQEEAGLWISLCKWKLGKVQVALDALQRLRDSTDSKDLKSRCLLSLAEIHLELDKDILALEALEEAAELTRNSVQKSQIYSRLAELAFKNQNYDKALSAYRNVIRTSLTKEKIETSHLQVLKIYRLQGNYKTATRKIKSMISDEKFKKIVGQLDLELVQLYLAQNEMEQAETRLQSVVNDYKKSVVSAEAYFLLGKIMIDLHWDLVKADEYFGKVGSEYNKSPFKFSAGEKQKEIQSFINTKEQIQIWKTQMSLPDSVVIVEDTTIVKKTLSQDFDPAKYHYLMADLEAFKFNRLDTSLVYFDIIRNEYQESIYYPKALFTSIFVLDQIGDSSQSLMAKNLLIETFPQSDYARYLQGESGEKALTSIEIKYQSAEKLISTDLQKALDAFIEITITDSLELLSASAAYFLGNHYDWIDIQADSAFKYYNWIIEHHPDSEQAKIARKRSNILQDIVSPEVETIIQDSIQVALPDSIEIDLKDDQNQN